MPRGDPDRTKKPRSLPASVDGRFAAADVRAPKATRPSPRPRPTVSPSANDILSPSLGKSILTAFDELIRSDNLKIVEEFRQPPRPEVREPLPPFIRDSRVGRWLMSSVAQDGTLWRHQSMALALNGEGHDVAITTSTASGKSLIFQTAGVRALESDPNAKIVVFYPLKALASDQIAPWGRALAGAGFSADDVVEITGDVKREDRIDRLERARVAILTPDVCHAWLMRSLKTPSVAAFVRAIGMIIVDEAHTLEAVFGSSCAYLLRRIEAVRSLLRAQDGLPENPFRYIAASATVADVVGHMKALTGREFSVIGGDMEGSPRYGRRVLHIASDDGAKGLPAIQDRLLKYSATGSFVTFVESRMGVERLAVASGSDGVRPYRNGFERKDRQAIEQALKSGALRGVISTSALEMGVDISSFALGINVGAPSSRRSLLQRIGRVGRSSPGVFVVMAPRDEFIRFGETFEAYVNGPVENCALYLANRYLAYSAARCLHSEIWAATGKRPTLPSAIEWPEGFSEIFEAARSHMPVDAPAEFRIMAEASRGNPQLAFPLRDIGNSDYRLIDPDGRQLATTSIRHAIRETAPGLVYLHLSTGWEVSGWRPGPYGSNEIHLVPASERRKTTPIMRSSVKFGLTDGDVIDKRLLAGPRGLLAECHLQVVESVEGWTEESRDFLYSELSQRNPDLSAKRHMFRTTGTVLVLDDKLGIDDALRTKIGTALIDRLKRSNAVLSGDVGAAVTDISLALPGMVARIATGVVIYDKTYGSLRLSEPLFTEFESFARDLFEGGLKAAGEREALDPQTAEALLHWSRSLMAREPREARNVAIEVLGGAEPGFSAAHSPGQTVFWSGGGKGEVVEPVTFWRAGAYSLAYRVAIHGENRLGVIPASALKGEKPALSWDLKSGKFLDAVMDRAPAPSMVMLDE